jgi:hypothetical protein
MNHKTGKYSAANALSWVIVGACGVALLWLLCFAGISTYQAYLATPKSPQLSPESLSLAATISEDRKAVQIQRVNFERRCSEVFAIKNIEKTKDKSEEVRKVLLVECAGIAQNYLRELDSLVKRHANLLDGKEADKKRDDSTTALMTLLGLVIAIVTMWLGWGASTIEKHRAEAKEMVDAARNMVDLKRVRLSATNELFELLLIRVSRQEATKALPNINYYLDLLILSDTKLLKQATQYLSAYWTKEEVDLFPNAQAYLDRVKALQPQHLHDYLPAF